MHLSIAALEAENASLRAALTTLGRRQATSAQHLVNMRTSKAASDLAVVVSDQEITEGRAALALSQEETQTSQTDLLASAIALALSRTETERGRIDLIASELANKDLILTNALLLTSEALLEKLLRSSQEETKEGQSDLVASESANRDLILTNALLLDERLRSRHDAAVEANAAKSRFLAAASHDLRQPLHAIGMFLAVLRSDPPQAKRKAIVDNITSAVASMQRMFTGLLDVVRLDAGMMMARPQTFRLQTAFDALGVTFGVSAHTKGLLLLVQPTSAVITTDPIMLQCILQNLVSNAISYTARGQIVVEARESPNGIGIAVHDTGIGIPADRLDDIFREFVRLNRSGGSENGIGLGLAIVKRQVTELGATIGVRSQLGTGSVFTLSLPTALHLAASSDGQEETVQSSLSGKRILLVDDHTMVLAALVMEVESWGARALPAASADEAMTLLSLMTPDLPDAAVVDLDLGTKVSGIALLEQIQAVYSAELPAVVVTGSTTAETLGMLNESGYHWLTKPSEPGALQAALIETLGMSRVGQHVRSLPR